MIQTCEKCGAINQSGAENCCFCLARLDTSAEPAEVSVSARQADGKGSLTPKQDWRSEVTNRIRTYRERKRKSSGDSQTSLLFSLQINEQQSTDQQSADSREDLDDTVDEPLAAPGALDDDQYEDPLQATLAAAAARMQVESIPPPVAQPAPEVVQNLLIDVSVPPAAAFEPAHQSSAVDYSEADYPQDSRLFPVAELSLRRRAGAVDAVCLSLAFVSILALFTGFGGRLALGRFDLFVGGSILALLYAQYFTLFTMMGGATPGMMLMGLRLVSFEGSAPAPVQLMWRSLGYIISGVTALMGFLWAFWDEDHLSWHDRLSRTYITSVEIPIEAPSSANHLSLF